MHSQTLSATRMASFVWNSANSDRETKVFLWVDQSYTYLMLFSGDPLPNVRRRSLAVEPMTCAPNAFRTGDALIRLEPGASFTGTWGIAGEPSLSSVLSQRL
jgi:aldose 1-epimerase